MYIRSSPRRPSRDLYQTLSKEEEEEEDLNQEEYAMNFISYII
jgi:hypothetical protein